MTETAVALPGGTKIEWADYTFNPWWGCSRVSAACDYCYAEAWAKRFGVLWGDDQERRPASDNYWREPLKWNRKAENAGVRRRVFCASMADVFEDKPGLDVPRTRLYRLILETPWLDWLLLTKRPENIRRMVPVAWLDLPHPTGTAPGSWPANVWVGTTAENQRYAALRLRHLLEVPAPVRFLSYEPALGPLDLKLWLGHGLDWVIAGGESGPHARPLYPGWVAELRDQCERAAVPFLFKQWGEWSPDPGSKPAPDAMVLPDGTAQVAGDTCYIPDALAAAPMAKVGKKAAGRELDGRTWDGLPTPELGRG
jgi:protein gp37